MTRNARRSPFHPPAPAAVARSLSIICSYARKPPCSTINEYFLWRKVNDLRLTLLSVKPFSSLPTLSVKSRPFFPTMLRNPPPFDRSTRPIEQKEEKKRKERKKEGRKERKNKKTERRGEKGRYRVQTWSIDVFFFFSFTFPRCVSPPFNENVFELLVSLVHTGTRWFKRGIARSAKRLNKRFYGLRSDSPASIAELSFSLDFYCRGFLIGVNWIVVINRKLVCSLTASCFICERFPRMHFDKQVQFHDSVFRFDELKFRITLDHVYQLINVLLNFERTVIIFHVHSCHVDLHSGTDIYTYIYIFNIEFVRIKTPSCFLVRQRMADLTTKWSDPVPRMQINSKHTLHYLH